MVSAGADRTPPRPTGGQALAEPRGIASASPGISHGPKLRVWCGRTACPQARPPGSSITLVSAQSPDISPYPHREISRLQSPPPSSRDPPLLFLPSFSLVSSLFPTINTVQLLFKCLHIFILTVYSVRGPVHLPVVVLRAVLGVAVAPTPRAVALAAVTITVVNAVRGLR